MLDKRPLAEVLAGVLDDVPCFCHLSLEGYPFETIAYCFDGVCAVERVKFYLEERQVMSLLERLRGGEVLVADGAVGTQLIERGLVLGECPEQMNLDKPEVLEEVARSYFNAGADIIQTNTFGGSPLKLAQYGLQDQTEAINVAAVRAVRRAIGPERSLSLSCGPSGSQLSPLGDTEPEIVRGSFERQIRGCVAERVDLICIETMTDLAEALLAIEAARAAAPDVPICATMTFDPTPNGFFTIMGVSVKQAAVGLTEAGADIVGSNCGHGIDNMIRIANEFKKYTTLPVIIQSNAGLPIMQGDRAIYSETPEYMAERCSQLLECGVNIIGGCCGTTPDHIAALRAVVDKHNAR